MLFSRLIALILELWERDKKKYPKNKFDFSIQYDLETYAFHFRPMYVQIIHSCSKEAGQV